MFSGLNSVSNASFGTRYVCFLIFSIFFLSNWTFLMLQPLATHLHSLEAKMAPNNTSCHLGLWYGLYIHISLPSLSQGQNSSCIFFFGPNDTSNASFGPQVCFFLFTFLFFVFANLNLLMPASTTTHYHPPLCQDQNGPKQWYTCYYLCSCRTLKTQKEWLISLQL